MVHIRFKCLVMDVWRVTLGLHIYGWISFNFADQTGNEKLSQLKVEFPGIAKYLFSSRKVYENNHVPIESGYYNNEKKEFVIEMEIHPDLQAHEGILHGGTEAYFLDIGGGMASLIEAQKLGKNVVTKKIKDKDLPVVRGSIEMKFI